MATASVLTAGTLLLPTPMAMQCATALTLTAKSDKPGGLAAQPLGLPSRPD